MATARNFEYGDGIFNAWEATIYSETIDGSLMSSRKSLGLSDLFGGTTTTATCNGNLRCTATTTTNSNASSTVLHKNNVFHGKDFFTLRLEHVSSGNNLDRILVFRSDQPGCIGKIVFSSKPPSKSGGVVKQRQGWPCEPTANDLQLLASARIHVLEIKDDCQGHDLGGLLFYEAVAYLAELYKDDDDDNAAEDDNDDDDDGDTHHINISNNDTTTSSPWFTYAKHPSAFLVLDAEEDTRRHGKLLEFYENMGCSIKPHARILYLNNNDAETYRKIPMQMPLRPLLRSRKGKSLFIDKSEDTNGIARNSGLSSSLIGKGEFVPVRLTVLASNGRQVQVNVTKMRNSNGTMPKQQQGKQRKQRQVYWIAIDKNDDGISFQTTQGLCLHATPSGTVIADNRPINNLKWECFKLRSVYDRNIYSDVRFLDDGEGSSASSSRKCKELWTLQTYHGSFLCVDKGNSNMLTTADYPVFWTVDNELLTLMCTRDTPLRRNYYHKYWSNQNLYYNQKMRERHLQFNNRPMGMWEALVKVGSISWYRFRRGGNTKEKLSLCSFLFHSAETARLLGQPDWVQLIALIHDLGRVVSLLLDEMTHDDLQMPEFDWTLSSKARVIGCPPPLSAKSVEYYTILTDCKDEQYNNTNKLGIYEEHCGLNNVLLSWSGSEYLYFMLKHNCVRIPEEGLAMLRYFPLKDWHNNSATSVEYYQQLTDENDDDLKPFVSEFERLISNAKKTFTKDLSDDECKKLWEQFYHPICMKYQCDAKLQW